MHVLKMFSMLMQANLKTPFNLSLITLRIRRLDQQLLTKLLSHLKKYLLMLQITLTKVEKVKLKLNLNLVMNLSRFSLVQKHLISLTIWNLISMIGKSSSLLVYQLRWTRIWRKLRIAFVKPQAQHDDSFYDLFEDYDLIEASFAQQYGIRLRQEDSMTWDEFCSLLSGLNGETPLGCVVRIRSEKDRKVIQKFTKNEREIYNAWKRKHMRKPNATIEDGERTLRALFGI